MLRNVSDGQYLDAIRNAEKFILHVEVLFAAIDDLEFWFAARNLKGDFSQAFCFRLITNKPQTRHVPRPRSSCPL
jgi:hypothetical protein